ncbi:MAG: response regulator transcription factor [Bacilli bacterium]|jgi:two-component system, OmpR family, alkaline phosphatase synthesis response regulator PhoP|nr:response regulator transcription factor [Bacilli bacterium]MDD3422090.1 response regulator transcription factor [Bacilli bacterium]MDD4065605.1 response regulator transcription factor [Bacilli bacterium]
MIWCIEDDASIRDIEVYALTSSNFEAQGFETASLALAALTKTIPGLIILDIMLPGMDGVEFLKKLKSNNKYQDIPIIMASAKGSEFDKVKALDLGVDDYLVKPFGMLEMVSRVKAVLRRYHKSTILNRQGITLDSVKRIVTVDQHKVDLTYKEFELLNLFLAHPGRVYTRDELFNTIWGQDYLGESRTVDMHIRSLRRKLGNYSSLIETVRNVGYRMEEKNDK